MVHEDRSDARPSVPTPLEPSRDRVSFTSGTQGSSMPLMNCIAAAAAQTHCLALLGAVLNGAALLNPLEEPVQKRYFYMLSVASRGSVDATRLRGCRHATLPAGRNPLSWTSASAQPFMETNSVYKLLAGCHACDEHAYLVARGSTAGFARRLLRHTHTAPLRRRALTLRPQP